MIDSGFSRPTLAQLITSIRTDITTQFAQDALLRRLDSEVYSRAQAAAVHTLYGYIDYLARNLLPDICDEEWLIRHANMKRCPRKPAVVARGFARWEGVSDGITVPEGALFQQDNRLDYRSTAEAVASNGVLRVPIECLTEGSGGNLDDGAPLMLMAPIRGLPSLALADSVTEGGDIEPLEAWRQRVIERWYWTPQGGADHDYVIWAKEIAGVERAWTYRHWMGLGSVGVMIASGDPKNPIPTEETVAAVKAHIEPLSPVAGSQLYVFPPVVRKVDFRILLTPDTEAIRYAVKAELDAIFLREGIPKGGLYLSRIGSAISLAAGSYKHQLRAPTEDILLESNELAMVGEILWE